MARISSFPHTIDFNAPATLMAGNGSLAVQPDGSLKITLPSAGQSEGGYGQHDFAPTARLHVRQRIVAPVPLPSCKWLIVMRSDAAGTEQRGCRRFIVQSNLYIGGRFVPYPTQGVCSAQRGAGDAYVVADQCDFNWNDYIGQEVCFEYVGDVEIGTYSVYVSTPDGRYNRALFMQIDLTTGLPFNPNNNPDLPEVMPSAYLFTSMRPMYWNDAAPVGTECTLVEMVVSDQLIGNPYSVPAPQPAPTPAPQPTPTPTPTVLAPAFTGGNLHVLVNGIEASMHVQAKEAYQAAGRIKLNDTSAMVEITSDPVSVTLE